MAQLATRSDDDDDDNGYGETDEDDDVHDVCNCGEVEGDCDYEDDYDIE